MAFKSDKDREAYVSKLRAAGFTPEEIDTDVAEIEASQPAPVAPPPVKTASAPPPVAQPNLQPEQPAQLVKKLADVAQARNEQNQDLTGQVLGNELAQAIKDLSGSDLGKAGLAVGAGYGLYKAGRLAERKFGPSGEIVNRIEPTMEPVKESARLPAAAQQSGLSEADQALLARSEANRIAKEQEAAKRAAAAPAAPPPEPPAFIRNQPPVAEPNPRVPSLLQPPAGAAAPPVTATPVAPAPAPVETTVKSGLPSLPQAQPGEQAMTVRGEKPVPMSALTTPEALQRAKVVLGGDTPERVLYNLNLVNERGGLAPWEVHAILGNQGMPSDKIKGTFEEPIPVKVTQTPSVPVPTAAEAPPKKEPKAAKAKIDMPSGWGKGMTWLVNQHGVEGAQAFIDQYNKGKPYATYDEMMKSYTENTMRPKYSDIPKSVRQERGITSRSGTMAVPPPSLRPTDLGQGGSLLRSLTDQLQLKQ